MRLLALLLFLGLAAARGDTVRIAGQNVRIPKPEGFVRYDGKSEKIDALQASFVPASNRVLAAFGEPEDLQEAASGQFPALSRSFSVQENWQYESDLISPAEFATVKAAIREHMESLKNTAATSVLEVEKSATFALSQKVNANLKVKIGEVAPGGVFAETPETICFSMLVKSRAAGGPLEDPIDPNTAVAGCVALVRDRLLYLYANSAYDGKADADWARAQIVLWRDAVLAANAPGAPEEADLPPEPTADDDQPWYRKKQYIAVALAALIVGWWFFRPKPLRLPG